MSYQYDVTNPTYRDVGCPSQCSVMYDYATVAEMNGVSGALPIPASSAERIVQPQANIPAGAAPVAPAAYLRRRN